MMRQVYANFNVPYNTTDRMSEASPKPQEFRMYVPAERSTGTYHGIPVGPNQYKLIDNDPFLEELCRGTVIEVAPKHDEPKVMELIRVVTPSDTPVVVYGLPQGVPESLLRQVGDQIVAAGGYWEVLFGGMAYVNLPKDSSFDVNAALKAVIAANGM